MKTYALESLDLPDCPAIAKAERFGGGYEDLKEEEEDDHENV